MTPRTTPRGVSALARALPLVFFALLPGACNRESKSTRLAADDFSVMSSEMAARLRASYFLAHRGPGSPPITVAVSKVDHLTTDLISDGEKWYLMDSVVSSEAMRAMEQEKNIRFVIPAERLASLRRRVPEASEAGAERRPTHAMTALIRSVTRSAGRDRTDLYSCEFRITQLSDGEQVWSDRFEFKRTAFGRAYN